MSHGFPLELALKVGNDEAPFPQASNERVQADVVGLLCIFSYDQSAARILARIMQEP